MLSLLQSLSSPFMLERLPVRDKQVCQRKPVSKTKLSAALSAAWGRVANNIGKGKFADAAEFDAVTINRALTGPSLPSAITRGVAAAAAARRARTKCKRGHPLSGDNLFLTTAGGRGCKECRKIHKATYRSKAHG